MFDTWYYRYKYNNCTFIFKLQLAVLIKFFVNAPIH